MFWLYQLKSATTYIALGGEAEGQTCGVRRRSPPQASLTLRILPSISAGENLGEWSELGVLSVLSGLQHEFYCPRLVPSLAAVATPQVAKVQQETVLRQ